MRQSGLRELRPRLELWVQETAFSGKKVEKQQLYEARS